MSLVEDVKQSANDVNDELSPNLRENAYHEAMKVELSERGIVFTSEATIPVMYRGFPVARMHPDLIVGEDERFILELKADRDGRDQLRTYLQYAEKIDMTDVEGGLMISFGEDLRLAEL